MKETIKEKEIIKRLEYLYGENVSQEVFLKLKKIIKKYRNNPIIKTKTKKYLSSPVFQKKSGPDKIKPFFSEKDVVLITYGDSLRKSNEKPLKTLHKFLKKYIKDSFSGIHILPFYPYSSDNGFSVIDYKKVNPELGNWNDIKKIGKDYRLMADLVINHISSRSKWFQEFLRGSEKYKNYFIWFDKKIDTSLVFRPRTNPVLTAFKTKWGTKYLWTTFSEDQIDLNFKNPDVLLEIIDTFLFYLSKSIEIIRIDAVAYLWKEKGTSCIHLKKTHEIIKLLRNILEEIAPYATLITETNVPYKENISYFGNNDEAHLIYNFSLPPLVVDGFLRKDSKYLQELFKKTEQLKNNNLFFNFLASHDGIGILAAKKHLKPKEFKNLLREIKKHNGYISYKSAAKEKIPYEMNINYFDAINNPKLKTLKETEAAKFMASQAILIFSKGVPGIYIHSLLGSRNYNRGVEQALKKEKIKNLNNRYRMINREKLNYDQLEKELKNNNSIRKKVFESYLKLLEIKKKNKDFNPYSKQKIIKSEKERLVLLRGKTKIVINLDKPFKVEII